MVVAVVLTAVVVVAWLWYPISQDDYQLIITSISAENERAFWTYGWTDEPVDRQTLLQRCKDASKNVNESAKTIGSSYSFQ